MPRKKKQSPAMDLTKEESPIVVDSNSDGDNDADDRVFVVEKSKTNRAECKRCETKIAKNLTRVGIQMDSDWGMFTRWQHLPCTVFPKFKGTNSPTRSNAIVYAESLEGFHELEAEAKEDVITRVFESQSEIDEDFIPIDPNEMVRKGWEVPLEPRILL